MTLRDDVRRLMTDYPRIYFACHMRHARDPRAKATISTTLASILDHLDDVEGTPLTELASHLGVTPSTMSLNVDRLERRGYATRRKDPADGRRTLITITPTGLRLREATSVLDPDLVRSLLRRLPPDRRAEALRGLSLLAEAATGASNEGRARRRPSRGAGAAPGPSRP